MQKACVPAAGEEGKNAGDSRGTEAMAREASQREWAEPCRALGHNEWRSARGYAARCARARSRRRGPGYAARSGVHAAAACAAPRTRGTGITSAPHRACRCARPGSARGPRPRG